LIPGFLTALSFILYIVIRCYRNPGMSPALSIEERPTLRQKINATKGVAFPMLLIVLVLGGIWTGVTTPIEGSGVGAFGAMVCALIKRKLSKESIKDAVTSTLKANSMVMWLLIGGSCYSGFMTASGASSYLGQLLLDLQLPTLVTVSILLIILFFMGTVMDSVAIMMITVPIFFPIVRALDVDLIWFGVVYTMAIVIGYITPPFGYNLFYMRGVLPPSVSTRVIFRSVLPYIPMMLGVLILCLLFPRIITYIPDLLIK